MGDGSPKRRKTHGELVEEVVEEFEDEYGNAFGEVLYHKLNRKHGIFYRSRYNDGNGGNGKSGSNDLRDEIFISSEDRILNYRGREEIQSFDPEDLGDMCIPKGDLDVLAYDFSGEKSIVNIVEVKSNPECRVPRSQLNKAKEHFSEYFDEVRLFYRLGDNGIERYEP